MIPLWMQSLVAIVTEVASLSLLDGSGTTGRLVAYFALHAVASALVTSLAWQMLPGHLKGPRWAVLGLLFSFDFFIPALGVVAMMIVMYIAMRYPSVMRVERYVEIAEPVFLSSEKEKREQSDVRAGHARRILSDPHQSIDRKLRVLIALQTMRPKVAIPLLQGLLADPSEDIRLLAYSMMDAWEKDITDRLQAAQKLLNKVNSHKTIGTDQDRKLTRQNAHRKLAELYWEQVDSGLARGDLRTFSLQRAKSHCEKALVLDARQGGLWVMYSSVLTELGQVLAADRALGLAHKAGAPDSVVCPHLARLAFDAGDYELIRTWMRRAGRSGHLSHAVRQCVRYWTGRSFDVKL